MTYTQKNILSSFEATGISPLNARRVLSQLPRKVNTSLTSPKRPTSSSSLAPNTPYHGKTILIHTRRAIALVNRDSPTGKKHIKMYEKLAKSAESATAKNIILKEEILRRKAQAISQSQSMKVKSRKVLTKAVIISADDIIKLREESDRKEQAVTERKEKAITKKGKERPLKELVKADKKEKVVEKTVREVAAPGVVQEIQVVEVGSGSEDDGWGSEASDKDGDDAKTRSQIIILQGKPIAVLAEKLAWLGLVNKEGTQKKTGARNEGSRTREAGHGRK